MSFKISDFNPDWIKKEIDDKCIEYMEGLGLHLCDKKNKDDDRLGRNAVTTSQLRNIFSEIKRLDVKINSDAQYEKEKTDILLLRPKIAYSTARVKSSKRETKMVDLRKVFEKAIIVIDDMQSFKRFAKFSQGIIAYHKVYGAKD